jgi:tRNA A37 methylthiotransferase MiaB
VIVGFPGESERDLEELERFLSLARLDAVGVFGYSDEDGTEAAGLPGKLPAEVVAERVDRVATLVEDVMSQRARERIGERLSFFVDEVADGGSATGRADHQGPDNDGSTTLRPMADLELRPGDTLDAVVVDTDGVDLVAEPVGAGDGGLPR